jgi:hypothetical protein
MGHYLFALCFFVALSDLVCGIQSLNTEVTSTVQLHDNAVLSRLM